MPGLRREEVASLAGMSVEYYKRLERGNVSGVTELVLTSAIIGPRTMEQLAGQLPAADARLDAAVLDRVDEIVRPGVTINPADNSYGEQVLEPALLRR